MCPALFVVIVLFVILGECLDLNGHKTLSSSGLITKECDQ